MGLEEKDYCLSFTFDTITLKINEIKQLWFQNVKSYTAMGRDSQQETYKLTFEVDGLIEW
jgi:hypothetical protein